ncbi:hypothetical protein T484DRAFT_2466660 [Baffinella frigidus]|nr:hypothetical protein T484DRAFT_2466660 [Cryptophyta sp. CCMP2293]
MSFYSTQNAKSHLFQRDSSTFGEPWRSGLTKLVRPNREEQKKGLFAFPDRYNFRFALAFEPFRTFRSLKCLGVYRKSLRWTLPGIKCVWYWDQVGADCRARDPRQGCVRRARVAGHAAAGSYLVDFGARRESGEAREVCEVPVEHVVLTPQSAETAGGGGGGDVSSEEEREEVGRGRRARRGQTAKESRDWGDAPGGARKKALRFGKGQGKAGAARV